MAVLMSAMTAPSTGYATESSITIQAMLDQTLNTLYTIHGIVDMLTNESPSEGGANQVASEMLGAEILARGLLMSTTELYTRMGVLRDRIGQL